MGWSHIIRWMATPMMQVAIAIMDQSLVQHLLPTGMAELAGLCILAEGIKWSPILLLFLWIPLPGHLLYGRNGRVPLSSILLISLIGVARIPVVCLVLVSIKITSGLRLASTMWQVSILAQVYWPIAPSGITLCTS